MNKEEILELLRKQEPDFLTPTGRKVNGHPTYICPNCGHGAKAGQTGLCLDIKHTDGQHYKCFRGSCDIYEDTIGLWQICNNSGDFNKAIEDMCQHYNIDSPTGKGEYQKQDKKKQYTHNSIHTNTDSQKDYTGYYRICAEAVGQTDYFYRRGFSKATIEKHMLGYDSNYYDVISKSHWKAVIIPTGTSSYIARNTDPGATKDDRYRKHGPSLNYLKETLIDASRPIFIVEGEMDALSVIETGGEALGLGSTNGKGQFLQAIKDKRPEQPIILALDNDGEGQKTTGELAEELTNLNIDYHIYNPYGKAKDANEALLASKELFMAELRRAEAETIQAVEEKKQAEREEYYKTSTAYQLQDFINGIADSVNTPYIPTGFQVLDRVLDGGLYEGLYIVGAISSLGKTTMVLQIADQIAEAGEDVLIFSLEMARSELMAKSISRLTLLDVLQNKGRTQDAKSTRGITTGSRYKNYSQTEQELIQRAITTYGQYAKNIYIHEGVGSIGVQEVAETIEKHIRITGKKPVVFIDYIQILAPADIRATDKQNTDKAVLELKRISRKYKIPVVGVSSVNRASYNTPASMEMLKESGSLEYGSDVIWGLQLKGVGGKDFDVNTAKNKEPREIELAILKNRNGATGGVLSFEYYPIFNYFKETR